MRAIPRKDFAPTAYNKVCADHFEPKCIENTTAYTDSRTGKVIEVSLPVPRLRPGSLPTIFPGCPSYLWKVQQTLREVPDVKRSRGEASQLSRALEDSLASYAEEKKKNCFSTFQEMKMSSMPEPWTVIYGKGCVIFLNDVNQNEPFLKASVTVFEDLHVSACFQGASVRRLGNSVVPESVHEISLLLFILENLCMLTNKNRSCEHLLAVMNELLGKAESSIAHHKKESVKFLKDQPLLLSSNRKEYSAQPMVYACILYTISAHAYKFLRSTSKLTLPHPSTIRKVCSSFQMSPEAEASDSTFLQYVAHRFKQLKPHNTM
nr:uncharacterized protein LOC129382971 [Dermacentor andersoni]